MMNRCPEKSSRTKAVKIASLDLATSSRITAPNYDDSRQKPLWLRVPYPPRKFEKAVQQGTE